MDIVDSRIARLLAIAALLAAWHPPAVGEPYLSVRSSQPCSACHSNPTGGGLRTAFGVAYAANVLSVTPLTEQPVEPVFDVANGLRVGGNARFGASQFDLEGSDGNLEFATERVSVYSHLRLGSVVELYLDQQVSPGGSLNRESWVRLSRGDWYLKAGKFFLPYGWRLEDDTALIRQATGINFATPDNGLELGFESHSLQLQLSVTNGAGGGSERDDGKFVTFRGNWLGRLGQLGISGGFNKGDQVQRTLVGIFAGVNTGPIAWLLEYDYIEDDADNSLGVEQNLALVEANWLLGRGHNLKISLEHQEFEGQQRDRQRVSAVWEYFPWSHTQLRTGVRVRREDSPVFAEGEHYFIELHIYF